MSDYLCVADYPALYIQKAVIVDLKSNQLLALCGSIKADCSTGGRDWLIQKKPLISLRARACLMMDFLLCGRYNGRTDWWHDDRNPTQVVQETRDLVSSASQPPLIEQNVPNSITIMWQPHLRPPSHGQGNYNHLTTRVEKYRLIAKVKPTICQPGYKIAAEK